MESLIVEGTNDFRGEQGVARLERNTALERAARYFASFMARTDRYGHEADGSTPSARAKVHRYDYCLVSENISYQYSSADFSTEELARRYLEGWKKSPGHRKNMAEPAVVHIGVAVARSAETGRYYAVQMFGRPKSKMIEFRITNKTRDGVRYRMDDESFNLPAGSARIHQVCSPEDVVLQGAREQRARPAHGDRLAVHREAGRLILRPDR
ncbi:MAG TPA: CAP domain-containing protein [Usitatibacter sp.]|nr:CAP domain-containing protein [Usitatibacter sp.]